MSHIPYPLRQITLIGILSVLSLILSACGPNSSSTTNGSGSGSKPTPTKTTVNNNIDSCPSNTVISTPPQQANVTIRITDSNSTVTAHIGDTIEVQLPFGQKWSGPLSTPVNLQLQQPAGYAFTPDKVCIWRFVAQSAGTAHLEFYGQALCPKGVMCPMYIIDESFTLEVV